MSLRVYYVDDEAELCEIFVDEFSAPEIEITAFNDPLTAINACNEKAPDIIFIDYRMPGMNGDKLAQKISPNIKKILITGEIHVDVETKFEAILSKPIMNHLVRDQLTKVSK